MYIQTGRYIKNSREYSQTPWAIKGKKLAENSVSECICETLKEHYRADGMYHFNSSFYEIAGQKKKRLVIKSLIIILLLSF